MKKHLVLTTLAAVIVATMSTTAFSQTELRMSWWGGNSRHQATLKALELFHQKYPDITVKGEYTGWDGHLSRLTTQIAGNTEPDVMQTNWNWMPIFSTDGKGFYDMGKLSTALHVDQFPQGAITMAKNAGILNGMPVSMTARVFYYNKDTWAKAGVPYPKTWKELMAAGKKFEQKLGKEYYPIVIEARDVWAMNRSYMIQKHGKDIINHKTNRLNYNEKEMTEFFQLYADQVAAHVFPSTKEYSSYGKGNLYEMRPWINGQFGGLYMWDTAIEKYTDNLKPPMSMDLGPYPMVPGATEAGLLSRPSMMFSIGRNTKHPAEAAKLVNFLLNDPQGVKAMGLARGIPLSSEAIEELTKDKILKKDSLIYQGYKEANNLPQKILPTPLTDNAQLMELFNEEMQGLDYGQTTPEKAAANFLRRGNRILARVAKE